MDGNRALNSRNCSLFFCGCGIRSSTQGADDCYEASPFLILRKRFRVIDGGETFLPWQSPNLEEVHCFGRVFILFGMRDAGSARCELHIASVETGEEVAVVA